MLNKKNPTPSLEPDGQFSHAEINISIVVPSYWAKQQT